LDEDFMNLFCKMESVSLITYLSCIILEENHEYLNIIVELILEILLNKINGCEKLKGFSKKTLEEIPLIDPKRQIFLTCLQNILLKYSLTDENSLIFEILTNLLYHPENFKLFKEHFGVCFIFEILLKIESNFNGVYTQVLGFFEFYIDKFTADDLDLYVHYFLNSNILKKVEKSDSLSLVIIDHLSLLSIHLSLNTNPILLDKIITQEHFYVNLFYFIIGLFNNLIFVNMNNIYYSKDI